MSKWAIVVWITCKIVNAHNKLIIHSYKTKTSWVSICQIQSVIYKATVTTHNRDTMQGMFKKWLFEFSSLSEIEVMLPICKLCNPQWFLRSFKILFFLIEIHVYMYVKIVSSIVAVPDTRWKVNEYTVLHAVANIRNVISAVVMVFQSIIDIFY
jgi:hypothetical protein